MSQVFLVLLSSSEPSFEYSITGEQLLIYVLHDESTYTYLWHKPTALLKLKKRLFLGDSVLTLVWMAFDECFCNHYVSQSSNFTNIISQFLGASNNKLSSPLLELFVGGGGLRIG
jgi:hypothetical protein